MISNVATFSWTSLRLRSHVRMWAIVVIDLVGGALFSALWPTLSLASMLYAALIPASVSAYGQVKRRAPAQAAPAAEASASPLAIRLAIGGGRDTQLTTRIARKCIT